MSARDDSTNGGLRPVACPAPPQSLKSTGSYLARTLSYEGAEFALAHVELDPVFQIM